MKAAKHPLIGTKPGGSTPAIAGTRIRVAFLVQVYLRLGEGETAVAGILEAYPDLTREQVVAALDYWRANRPAIEAEIADEEQAFVEDREKQARALAATRRT